MPDKKSVDNRRKLLKTFAVGSGAVLVEKSLPETWVKPVINSIVLPVHAELTNDAGTCPELVIPDALHMCANRNDNSVYYHVDDTGEGCPELMLGRGPNLQTTIEIENQTTQILTGIRIITFENSHAPGSQVCNDPAIDLNVQGSRSFDTLSGASWTVSYTMIRRVDHVGIIDIKLSPAV